MENNNRGVHMRKIIIGIGMSILIGANLVAKDLDLQVIKTYQYMANDKKFHYNGKVLGFPEYGINGKCINKNLLKPETISQLEVLKKKIQKPFDGVCRVDGEKGDIGYINADTVGLADRGEYVFRTLKTF